MSSDPATWIDEFLRSRELDCPDGRALYAYRCTAEEFDLLTQALSRTSFDIIGVPRHCLNLQVRAFVLYAAEWWQRRYDGGHWAWEPLLESIRWRRVHYTDLYKPVREALRWWRVDLVRLPTSVRYLGTFACQGGLPLGLVADVDSRVVQYLRAVLKHTAEYREFVDDAIVLARDQEHLLRPPTLRRDYVFRLVADLIKAVLDLRDDAQGEDPINTLDQVRRGWRKTMPLSLENERARNLLTGLLREAVQDRLPTDEFRVERFLRKTSVGWRLGARVQLPASISAEHLTRHLKVLEKDLPRRLQVHVHGDRVHDVGLYAAQSDNFVLVDRKKQSQTELWDAEAAAEVRLQFLSGGAVGAGVDPYRGIALGELPWVFRGDSNECLFIGEGSVSSRAPEIVVLVPAGCTADQVDVLAEPSMGEQNGHVLFTGEDIHDLDRDLWRITGPTRIVTDHGQCIIKPASSEEIEKDYQLIGQRYHDLESAWLLFRGSPRLRVFQVGQAPHTVPTNEVRWRQTGGGWQQHPDAYGLWEVQHMRGGELQYLNRVGILPEQFRLSLEPHSGMTGSLVLTGVQGVKVSVQDEETKSETQIKGDEIHIRVIAKDTSAPPSKVCLKLHWQGQAQLHVKAPFPGHGGHFLRNGKLLDRELAVDDLYGVRAIALSPKDTQQFWLDGELKTSDLENNLLRAANFRRPLRKSGLVYELPLFEVRPMIEQLLAASSSGEARVALRIMSPRRGIVRPNEREYAEVRRFKAVLEHDSSKSFISISSALDDNGTTVTFEALPLARPDTDPVPLDVINSADVPHGAILPQDLNLNEPWLVIARHDGRVRVRPIVIGGNSIESVNPSTSDAQAPRLCEAVSLRDQDSRTRAISAAMDAMSDAEDAHRIEEEWAFLADTLLRAEGLPATSLDLLKVLVEKPNLLVRCMFRLGGVPRQLLWRLEDELPFSWLLVQREVWRIESMGAFERIRGELSGMPNSDQMASDYIYGILKEGTERFQGLGTVACDIGFRSREDRVPDTIEKDARRKRDDKTQEQLHLRYSMDDWPRGNGRREWVDELEQGQLLDELGIWQDKGKSPLERQPIFDTPVAAAWCCFHSKPTNRTTFLVKRIRTHDPEWFDLAYEAAWFQLAIMQDRSNR